MPRDVRKLSYYDLYREVNRVAYMLRNSFGLKKGDRIAVYLPMIPELPIFMLAAARLGVIFTVVFAGFTTESLALQGFWVVMSAVSRSPAGRPSSLEPRGARWGYDGLGGQTSNNP